MRETRFLEISIIAFLSWFFYDLSPLTCQKDAESDDYHCLRGIDEEAIWRATKAPGQFASFRKFIRAVDFSILELAISCWIRASERGSQFRGFGWVYYGVKKFEYEVAMELRI